MKNDSFHKFINGGMMIVIFLTIIILAYKVYDDSKKCKSYKTIQYINRGDKHEAIKKSNKTKCDDKSNEHIIYKF